MYCRHCGNELKENARFCTKCGKPVKKKISLEQEGMPVTGDNVKLKTQTVIEDKVQPEEQKLIKEKEQNEKSLQKRWSLACILGILVIFILVGVVFIVWKAGTSDKWEEDETSKQSTTTQEVTTKEDADSVSTEEKEVTVTETETKPEETPKSETVTENGNSYMTDVWCSGYKMLIPEGFQFDKEEDDLTGFEDDKDGTYLIWGARKAKDKEQEEGFGYFPDGRTFFKHLENDNISYSRVEEDYCCYSYADDKGMIYYNAYHFDDEMMYGFELRYHEEYKEEYDAIVEKLSSYITKNSGREKKIVSVDTSSVLESQEEKSYSGSNLIDGKEDTAWVEGVDGVGDGESITLHLKTATEIWGIDFLNGYFASAELYDKNGKVNKVMLDFGNNVVIQESLPVYAVSNFEEGTAMYEYGTFIELNEPVTTDTIVITIMGAESGDKYDDTCISEIKVY